jgi:hypothetical protein
MKRFAGRAYSSITEEEINDMTDKEYVEYQEWGTQITLDYLVAEGFVTTYTHPVTGETIYKLAEEV